MYLLCFDPDFAFELSKVLGSDRIAWLMNSCASARTFFCHYFHDLQKHVFEWTYIR